MSFKIEDLFKEKQVQLLEAQSSTQNPTQLLKEQLVDWLKLLLN